MLAPRKGFDFEIRKPFETSSSLWWVWLATRWHALRALSSWNNPHSLGFCGSTSWFWPQLCGDSGSTISFTNFVTYFSFFSMASCLMKTLLHLEAVMKPALWIYHSSHCHCIVVVLSTRSLSTSLKVSNLNTSLIEMLGWPLIISWEGLLIFFNYQVFHFARFSICSRFFNPDT